MRTIVNAIVVVGLGTLGGIAVLYYAHSEPSTIALNADLDAVRAEIKAADEESARYDGGLIKVMIEARKEILKTSQAMLELKKASIIRRVDLKYEVSATPIPVADDKTLDAIEKDLEKARTKLQSDEAEADRYSGGMIQAMALMAAATDRTALSQLGMAYYAKKYGFAMPTGAGAVGGAPGGISGKVVKDKDAL